MSKLLHALFCALLVLALLQSTNCGKFGRGGGHSYPSSHGLSGSRQSSNHGYPSSGSLSGSGSGNRHGYPSSGGMSGSGSGNRHGYPSSGGGMSGSGSGNRHGYPSSGGGMSGSGSGTQHGYPSSGGMSGSGSGNKHGYPSTGGMSGSGSGNKHSYPSTGGISGGSHGYPNRGTTGNTHHTTVINHNYHYSPPQQIRYAAPGQAAHSYPVYHGSPPTYVYQYKNSDSKYGTLLAGLALLNLGTLGASVYAASKAGSNSASSNSYKTQPGEYCKFGIKKDNGDYEETKIDCNLISSFIYQEQARTPQQATGTNTTVVTSVTNVTVVNMTNGVPNAPVTTTESNIIYKMLANGTFVPVNGTLPVVAAANSSVPTVNATAANGTVTSMTVTTTTTNTTTVTNALDVKGEAIKVTPGMQCFVIRHTPTNNMRKTVPCGLLQSYADQSIKRNSAAKNIPTFTVLCAIVAFVFY